MTDRVDRCLSNVEDRRGVNRCTSPRVPGSDYCSGHLSAAVSQYRAITERANEFLPGGHPSAVPFAIICWRCGRPGHDPRVCDA
jgi:hypothetical protein